MLLLRLLPAILCAWLQAAHAMRAWWGVPVVVLLALLPLTFLVRRPAVPILWRVALVAGALEWLRTAAEYAAERAAIGQPAGRLWAILGGVAAFHLLALLLLSGGRVRAWFRFPCAVPERPAGPAART